MEWIDVNDRLPEEDERRIEYLIWDGEEMAVVPYREYSTGFDFEAFIGTATHWMPLPQPPIRKE